jgi:competence protein ComEC
MTGSGRPPILVVLAVLLLVALSLTHREAIKARADRALGEGMPAREAGLARGFVLGEDEGVDAITVEDFRRAGLSHLLAVSGQNVALLALLAMPLLAAFGLPLRVRLVWVLGAIVVYVPLAGASPSIVRAGVMGGLSVLATLAGRRTPRLYALALAAAVTLAIDPRIGADVGWQLSFAAVLGILIVGRPLRVAIEARVGRGGWRTALAEGAAMTIAATVATAPLIAFHFEALSTTTLLANLLALPAVAPAMWLGMLAAVAGQVPGFPVGALNSLAAPLLAYIAQVATWCGRPTWAYVHVRIGGAGLAVSYLALGAGAIALPAIRRRCRVASLRRASSPHSPRCKAPLAHKAEKTLHRRRNRRAGALAAVVAVALVAVSAGVGSGASPAAPPFGLRVEVLDVGQGDAILLQPAGAPAVLVDGGPPGDGLAAKLEAAGVDRLGVAVVTHEQSDHSGGIEELLGRFPVERLAYARIGRHLLGEARAAGAGSDRLAEGDSLRSGQLRIEVLWPPQALLSAPLFGADPNEQALVLVARWRDFSILLTADAEAESVPIESGPVDVLKVAHHGSEDRGLDALLDRTRPKLAVISVGAGNPYGHPTPETLAALRAHHVPTLRTDLDGTIELDVRQGMVEIGSGS